jgi:hypothetical protein
MEYGKTDHELAKEGASFYQAITKKLGGVPPAQDEALKVKEALKIELQEKLTKEKMVIFESNYGWAYTVGYGRAGEVTMLKPGDLA